jgi:hypothetical protein
MTAHFEQVPPPKEVPWNEIGETLGLCKGLKPEKRQDQFRCCNCLKMQHSGSWLVWVPDSVMPGDPVWSIEEAARLNSHNGSHGGWCLACAPKAKKDSVAGSIRRFWSFLTCPR